MSTLASIRALQLLAMASVTASAIACRAPGEDMGSADDGKGSVCDGCGGSFAGPGDGGFNGSIPGDATGPLQYVEEATGGQAPNLQFPDFPECGEVFYKEDFVTMVAEDAHATFGGSYVKAMLGANTSQPGVGLPPAPSLVQANELLNFQRDIGYPSPATNGDVELTVYSDIIHAPVAEAFLGDVGTEALLQVAVVAPQQPRRDLSLTILVDTSTSMTGESMTRAKAVLAAIAGQLTDADEVNVLTWTAEPAAGESAPPLDSLVLLDAPPDPSAALSDLASSIAPQPGVDDLAGALGHARQAADLDYVPERSNRILIITDGATAFDQETAQALDAIGAQANPIQVMGIGVGPATGYAPTLLAQVRARTSAWLHFVGSGDDVEALLTTRFAELFDDVARDVRLELALPDMFEAEDFLGPELVGPDVNALVSQGLGNGGVMVFRKKLTGCSAAIYQYGVSIGVGVTYTSIAGDLVTVPLEYISLTDQPKTMETIPPRVLRTFGLLSFAEALRQPSEPRMTTARANMEMVNGLLNDNWLGPYIDLLDRHPVLASP